MRMRTALRTALERKKSRERSRAILREFRPLKSFCEAVPGSVRINVGVKIMGLGEIKLKWQDTTDGRYLGPDQPRIHF